MILALILITLVFQILNLLTFKKLAIRLNHLERLSECIILDIKELANDACILRKKLGIKKGT